MSHRNILCTALVFVAGLVLGRFSTPSASPPRALTRPDLTQEAGIMSLDNPPGTQRRLTPFRVVMDGQAQNVPGVGRDGEKWRIDLADGRVTLFVVSIP